MAERITVGMGATIHGWTDQKSCTVVRVNKSGTRVTLREDKAVLLNGVRSGEPDALQFSPGGFLGHTSGAQRWQVEPDPNGSEHEFSLRSVGGTGRWVRVGESAKSGISATIGKRCHHYDFNF